MVSTPPNSTSPLPPQSTPIKINASTTLPFTTHNKYRIETCTAMAAEIEKYLVGPMPVQQFLDDFFPVKELPHLPKIRFKPGTYNTTIIAKSEKNAYDPFVSFSHLITCLFSHTLFFKVISTQVFAPKLKIVNSSDIPDCNPQLDFPFKIKPDISVYSIDLFPGVVADSSKVEMFLEFKWKSNDDPFCDVYTLKRPNGKDGEIVKSFLRDTKAAKDTLGQITAYAAAQLGSQFRTHIYSILIIKDTARILRWDRSGTLVTEAIRYNKSCHLTEFFRRYSEASPEMRGKDRSVLDPTPAEAAMARQALRLDNTVPLVKLMVPDTNGPLHYIAASPRVGPYTPPGRATRGFPAFNVS
jgi:hypothetical protein